MIKFFRKIRQKLLQQNKVGSYLKYAIGEILLVVIGILIALSINNWNEERKELNLEEQLLNALRIDLIKNQDKIRRLIHFDSSFVARNDILLNLLKDKYSTYNDSLQKYFGRINTYVTFFPQQMAYENLKAKGLGIIRNDTIRGNLVELYDETYFHSLHIGERKSLSNHNAHEYFVKRLYPSDHGAIPNDFESLKVDTEFINRLAFITEERKGMLFQSRYMLNNTDLLIELIEKETLK